jgi:hypothetical protein
MDSGLPTHPALFHTVPQLPTQPALFHTVPQLGGLYMQDMGQVTFAKSVSIALTTFYKGWLLVSG